MAVLPPNRITLWSLEGEGADPEYFGKVDIGGASTLQVLRVALETNDALEWPFDFWDTKDKRRMRKKLERLNGFSKEVHVIRVAEGELAGNKRHQLGDGLFTANTVEVALALEYKGGGIGMDPTVLLIGSSRVTGSKKCRLRRGR